jgi:hypothetical protein
VCKGILIGKIDERRAKRVVEVCFMVAGMVETCFRPEPKVLGR